MRVLLVEDDGMIGAAVMHGLKDAAYAVDWVKNGEDALSVLSSQEYSVVLLDLGLPKKNGFEVLKVLRERGISVPLIIITARDAVDDRIMGLDLGADDYLVKPFEIGELLARVRAVVRRKGGNAVSILSNGPVQLNMVTHELLVDGKSNVLSAREFSLMRALLIRPGAILSRSKLEDDIYGWNEEVESNAVEVLIHSVRKKYGSNIIKNVRGAGWVIPKAAE